MTMVPAQTQSLSKQQQEQHNYRLFYGGYGGCAGGYNTESFGVMSQLEEGYDYCINEANCILGSDLVVANPMAEDESRTNSLNEAAGSSSKDDDNNNNNTNNSNTTPNNNNNTREEERDEGWLQLGIGGNTRTATHNQSKYQHHHVIDPSGATRGGLIELDLLPGGGSSSSHQGRPLSAPIFHVPSRSPVMNIAAGAPSFSTSLFFHQHQQPGSGSSIYPHHQEINWAFRHMPHNIAMAPSSSSSPNSQSSSSSLMPLGSSYFSRPFQVHSSGGVDVAGPSSSDFRVIDPPRRPHSGIWFTLQASQNQAQEPFLPQISKSYLRIKDGRMTVRLLMKYLVNKLRLDSESEVEITCRGQQLLPFLTLQHVRDHIWSPRDAITLLPDSSTVDHIMVLHYARSPHK
ncbi:protein LAX PANICLE 2 isoform X2 [Ricinus communis]|uniref:protein LAX PANICLE 2 isoform X2 n=1 Tax=Ricinus communis TaxID=3988 RepID=UPI0007723D3A|nr:protein LAX PANICLE 2 isoform X2 [Ricinus communis]|eukprot:XP_015570440.1 protein LAX PANICLE 2 isoform X2 [Ricinus communis]